MIGLAPSRSLSDRLCIMQVVISFLLCTTYVVIALAWLLRPWNVAALRAIRDHPPLGPFVPGRWWTARLLRFGRTTWRALLAIQLIFLSTLLAADFRSTSGQLLVHRWYANQSAVLSVLLLFIIVGSMGDAALQIWRISREDDWSHGKRSVLDCAMPTIALAVVALVSWGVLLQAIR